MADESLNRELSLSTAAIAEDYRQIERQQLGPQERRAEQLVTKLKAANREVGKIEKTVRGFGMRLAKKGASLGWRSAYRSSSVASWISSDHRKATRIFRSRMYLRRSCKRRQRAPHSARSPARRALW